jgi:amino acid permease
MAEAVSARGGFPGKTAVVVVLAVIAVLAVVAGIIYFAEPAKSLPSFLGAITHPAGKATAHRSTRGIVALVVGVVFLVAAGFTSRLGKSSSK